MGDLVTITDAATLRWYGWKDPVPSSVTAAPRLWKLWRSLKLVGR